MNTHVIADTGPLYAAVDRDDQFHQRARVELSRLADEQITVIVCAPVLIEMYTLVSRRLSLPAAHRWADEISRNSGFLNPDVEDYSQAIRRAQAFDDQPFTLVDCVIAILSERLGLKVCSYDHHFDIMRVERWQ